MSFFDRLPSSSVVSNGPPPPTSPPDHLPFNCRRRLTDNTVGWYDVTANKKKVCRRELLSVIFPPISPVSIYPNYAARSHRRVFCGTRKFPISRSLFPFVRSGRRISRGSRKKGGWRNFSDREMIGSDRIGSGIGRPKVRIAQFTAGRCARARIEFCIFGAIQRRFPRKFQRCISPGGTGENFSGENAEKSSFPSGRDMSGEGLRSAICLRPQWRFNLNTKMIQLIAPIGIFKYENRNFTRSVLINDSERKLSSISSLRMITV